MRPVIQPKGKYYTDSLSKDLFPVLNDLIGSDFIGKKIKSTRCLALCLQAEISRLYKIIEKLPAGDSALQVVSGLKVKIEGGKLPILIESLDTETSSYTEMIAALPAENQKIVDNYAHYQIILRNLQYDPKMGKWESKIVPFLYVADLPYAMSAMQDVRGQILRLPNSKEIRIYFDGKKESVLLGELPDTTNDIDTKNNSYNLKDIDKFIQGTNDLLYDKRNEKPLAYGQATEELLSGFGAYCAYCGAKFVNDMSVEHILPASEFPSLAKSWFNFLPSCKRCNSRKQARPKKVEMIKAAEELTFTKDDKTKIQPRLADENKEDPRINDLEYTRLYKDLYQFPTDVESYKNVGFALYEVERSDESNKKKVTYKNNKTSIQQQLNWTIQKVDEEQKELIVNTPGTGKDARHFEVVLDQHQIGGPGLLATPDKAKEKVARMAEVCSLDDTKVKSDRRLLERTETWFMALEAVKRIQDKLEDASSYDDEDNVSRLIYNLWLDNTILIIKEKGFLSVWLKIFTQFKHPLGKNARKFPAAPKVGEPLIPIIGGAGGGEEPQRGKPMSLAQEVAQTILETGQDVKKIARRAAENELGLAENSDLTGKLTAKAESAARKAGASHSKYFPNTNWDQVP